MIRRILGREVVLELSLGEVGETRALARELEQVLFNLVVNAREAITNSGTVRISTSLRSAEAGPSVVLEVSDDGSGMSADTLARISTPFFTTKARGSGVGLTTVFETVQRWGGTVEVDSTLGGGTTFRVLVPSTPAQQRTQSPTHQHRVLLVDDDDTALTVIGDALRSAGFEVVQCNGGDLALDVFARESVDVVVSDIVMPRMRGTELARRVHERSQGVPVVLMSAHPRERFGGEVDATVSFLQKPFSPSVLVSKVHEVIAAR